MKKGFTILETVFGVALSLLIFLAMHSMYRAFGSLQDKESSVSSANTSAGNVLTSTETIVLPADRILASHVFSTGTYTTGSTTLVTELPAVDTTGAIISGSYDYAVLYASSTSASLRLEAAAGSARKTRERVVGTGLSNLTFTYSAVDVTNAHSVTAVVTFTTTNNHQTSSSVLQETVRARNLTI